MKTKNIFDSLPAICAPKTADLRDELDRYLSTDPEHTNNVLLWWTERRGPLSMLVAHGIGLSLDPWYVILCMVSFFNAYILCSYLC
jgi:hypothetical protein